MFDCTRSWGFGGFLPTWGLFGPTLLQLGAEHIGTSLDFFINLVCGPYKSWELLGILLTLSWDFCEVQHLYIYGKLILDTLSWSSTNITHRDPAP